MTHLVTIGDRGLEIVQIRIPDKSITVGKTIRELSLPSGSTLSLIIRKEHKPIIPKANTILHAEDQIIAVTTAESEEALRTTLRGT